MPPHVVEIVSDGDFYDTGSEVGRDRSDIVSAEWFGPIQPPRDNRQITELFHNRLTSRGKQVLADAALEHLEEQENDK